MNGCETGSFMLKSGGGAIYAMTSDTIVDPTRFQTTCVAKARMKAAMSSLARPRPAEIRAAPIAAPRSAAVAAWSPKPKTPNRSAMIVP